MGARVVREVTPAQFLPGRPRPSGSCPSPGRRQLQEAQGFCATGLDALIPLDLGSSPWPYYEMRVEPSLSHGAQDVWPTVPETISTTSCCKGPQEGPRPALAADPKVRGNPTAPAVTLDREGQGRTGKDGEEGRGRRTGKDGKDGEGRGDSPKSRNRGGRCSGHCYSLLSWGTGLFVWPQLEITGRPSRMSEHCAGTHTKERRSEHKGMSELLK